MMIDLTLSDSDDEPKPKRQRVRKPPAREDSDCVVIVPQPQHDTAQSAQAPQEVVDEEIVITGATGQVCLLKQRSSSNNPCCDT